MVIVLGRGFATTAVGYTLGWRWFGSRKRKSHSTGGPWLFRTISVSPESPGAGGFCGFAGWQHEREERGIARTATGAPAWSLTSCATVGKLLKLLCLGFSLGKIDMIITVI